MGAPSRRQVTGLARQTESDGVHEAVFYVLTFADGTQINVEGACPALDAVLAQLAGHPPDGVTMAFPLVVTPNPTGGWRA